MTLIACPDCGGPLSTEAYSCPKCGRPTRAPSVSEKSASALVKEALAAQRSGDARRAMTLLETVVREHPDSTLARPASRLLAKINAAPKTTPDSVTEAPPEERSDALLTEALAALQNQPALALNLLYKIIREFPQTVAAATARPKLEGLKKKIDATQRRRKSRSQAIGSVILIGLVVLFYRGCIYESPEDVAHENAAECTDPVAAYVAAEQLVKRVLKAPGTAKFPSMYEVGSPVSFSDGIAEVHAYVDAQNGFGALIRNSFIVKMSCDPKTATWHQEDLKLDE